MATRKKTPAKPEPVAVTTICSVCGLPWLNHGKDPTTEDCIRLLKDELASRPITVPQPYPVPVRPYLPWYWEEWHTKLRPYGPQKIWCASGEQSETSQESPSLGQSFNERTPRLLTVTCKATNGPSL